jgi:replicative DNA helicase
MDRTESIVLRGLMYDDTYMRAVMPFLNADYFTTDKVERTLFCKIKDFIDKYNRTPTKEAIAVELSEGVEAEDLEEYVGYLNTLEDEKDSIPPLEWATDKTEEWCQEKALHNAVLEAINVLNGKSTKTQKGMIPKLLQDALAVSFDPHVGHDYLEDAESRYDFYHKADSRIPFYNQILDRGLKFFDAITKNGVPNKTLNICLAGTNVGKSLFMCDLASNYLLQGKNVLYITMEMAEERIAERIDANMMNRQVDDLQFMSKELYLKQIDRINSLTKGGRLVIKEYPTAQAHVGHFRHLLNELLLKKRFKPDVIFIDYLNICASSRVKASSGLYELVKSIAEELRGLAVEFNLPIWSATQMNRAGYGSSDPDLTNTSESFGLPATADLMFALINSEELSGMNQLLVKILKNRYGDVHMKNKETGKSMSKFAIGVDRSKQKLFNLEDSAQKHQEDDGPLSSRSTSLDDDSDAASFPTAEPSYGQADETIFDIDVPVAKEADTTAYKEKQQVNSAWGSLQQPKKNHWA